MRISDLLWILLFPGFALLYVHKLLGVGSFSFFSSIFHHTVFINEKHFGKKICKLLCIVCNYNKRVFKSSVNVQRKKLPFSLRCLHAPNIFASIRAILSLIILTVKIQTFLFYILYLIFYFSSFKNISHNYIKSNLLTNNIRVKMSFLATTILNLRSFLSLFLQFAIKAYGV